MAELVGRSVCKKFGRKSFKGAITDYFEQENWYHVIFEDGDEEDIDAIEASKILVPLPEEATGARRKGAPGSTGATSSTKATKAKTETAAPPFQDDSSSIPKRRKRGKQGEGADDDTAPAAAGAEQTPVAKRGRPSHVPSPGVQKAAAEVSTPDSTTKGRPKRAAASSPLPSQAQAKAQPKASVRPKCPTKAFEDTSEEGKENTPKRAKVGKEKKKESSRIDLNSMTPEDAHAAVKACIVEYNRLRLEAVEVEKARVAERKAAEARGEGTGKKASARPDLLAMRMLIAANKHVSGESKQVGACPGIPVGFKFESRAEMCITGAHSQHMAGIDYISGAKDERQNVCVALVHGTDYEDNCDTNAQSGEIVYTGQGGNDLLHSRSQIADQILERGNKARKEGGTMQALTVNIASGIPVRMFFKNKDKSSYTGVTITYDGLWDVTEYWREKGKSNFYVFKYRLKRQKGQPTYKIKTVAEEQAEAAAERERKRLLREEEQRQKLELQQAIKEAREKARDAERETKAAAAAAAAAAVKSAEAAAAAAAAAAKSPKRPSLGGSARRDSLGNAAGRQDAAAAAEARPAMEPSAEDECVRVLAPEGARHGAADTPMSIQVVRPAAEPALVEDLVLLEGVEVEVEGRTADVQFGAEGGPRVDAMHVAQFVHTFRRLLFQTMKGHDVSAQGESGNDKGAKEKAKREEAEAAKMLPADVDDLVGFLEDPERLPLMYLAVLPLALTAFEVLRRLAMSTPAPDAPTGADLAALLTVSQWDITAQGDVKVSGEEQDAHLAALRWLCDVGSGSPEVHTAVEQRLEAADEAGKKLRAATTAGRQRVASALAAAKEETLKQMEKEQKERDRAEGKGKGVSTTEAAVGVYVDDLEAQRQRQRLAREESQRESDSKTELRRRVAELTRAVLVEEEGKRAAHKREHDALLTQPELQIRAETLGKDRHWRTFWWLPAARTLLAAPADAAADAADAVPPPSEARRVCTAEELLALQASLDVRGVREHALRSALAEAEERGALDFTPRSTSSAATAAEGGKCAPAARKTRNRTLKAVQSLNGGGKGEDHDPYGETAARVVQWAERVCVGLQAASSKRTTAQSRGGKAAPKRGGGAKGDPALDLPHPDTVAGLPELKELLLQVEIELGTRVNEVAPEESSDPEEQAPTGEEVPTGDAEAPEDDAEGQLAEEEAAGSEVAADAVDLDALPSVAAPAPRARGKHHAVGTRIPRTLWADPAERTAWEAELGGAPTLASVIYCWGLLARRIAAARNAVTFVPAPLWDRSEALELASNEADEFAGDEHTEEEEDTEDEGDVFFVDRILNTRLTGRKPNQKTEYLVKWHGYPISEATWEPESNLASARDAILEYKNGGGKGSSKGGAKKAK